jgi:nucleotide-binding universal stress UspA family protein
MLNLSAGLPLRTATRKAASGMTGPVIAGVDGSPQSIAAAHWAAGEALRRGAELHLMHVWPWLPHVIPGIPSPIALQAETRRMLARAQADIVAEYPELVVETRLVTTDAANALVTATEQAQVLVLGSRGLGGFHGLLVGSTGLETAARSRCPVVLVRRSEDAAQPAQGEPRRLPVVLGLDARHPSEVLIEFALRAAADRGTWLRVVHTWGLPPLWSVNPMHLGEGERGQMEDTETQLLRDAVLGWQSKYPAVDIRPDVRLGSAAETLVDEARQASLLVVGRHLQRPPLGLRLGPVAHAVIHHAVCPVAVIPHD